VSPRRIGVRKRARIAESLMRKIVPRFVQILCATAKLIGALQGQSVWFKFNKVFIKATTEGALGRIPPSWPPKAVHLTECGSAEDC
jgi:hypothetical protein